MGIHIGKPNRKVDPITKQVTFSGSPVNVAASITTLSQGGQILLSSEVWEKAKENEELAGRCSYLGKYATLETPEGGPHRHRHRSLTSKPLPKGSNCMSSGRRVSKGGSLVARAGG